MTTRGVQVNDNTYSSLLSHNNEASVSLFGVLTRSREGAGKEQQNDVGGKRKKTERHSLWGHALLQLGSSWIWISSGWASSFHFVLFESDTKQQAALLMSYRNTTCAVLFKAPQNALSRRLSVFLPDLHNNSSLENLLWHKQKTQPAKASNIIAEGYEAPMSFIVSPFEFWRSSWQEPIHLYSLAFEVIRVTKSRFWNVFCQNGPFLT